MSEEQNESTTLIDERIDTDDTMSSDGLEIDISESPKTKKEINIEDKRVLDNIEEEIERQYDEKAAKSNLTAVNVKNILRNVITNEHVWAMVKNSTGESVPDDEHAVYEPKLTRAKAKELLKNKNVPPSAIPWVSSPGPKSEVHILINQDLPEDSDDDEYVPHEEESEDEKESFHPSDVDSQPATPATPTSTHDTSTQTIWTEDGNFKVPQTTSVPKTPTHDKPEETVENIALRTRSKLSLSDTPLEIIEEAFIPPDITTDMYDLECDDEDWKDFLKKFTRPLDEAVTGAHEDDDEADPEYNVLSDEEIDKLDKEEKEEEFRQDKRVKITKKELNTLVAELFEFSEIFSNTNEFEDQQQITENTQENNTQENFTADQSFANETFAQNSSQVFSPAPETSENYSNLQQTETEPKPQMTLEQVMLFEQQMRQHVQMLTQNYVLSYKHVFYDNLSKKFKDMLLSLDELSKYKLRTAFRAHNLAQSVDFIKEWDALIATNSKEVQEMLCYVSKVANEFKRYDEKNAEYVVTFPPLLMKKISESPAFIYPSLLPKIPFRYSSREIKKGIYVKGENELIAIGLEQFRDYLKDNVLFRTRNGLLSNMDICNYICEYMMPHRDPKKLHWYVQRMRYLKEPNPINYYFANNKAPVAMHYVCSLEQYGTLPPCMRPPDSLPYQWKNFLYPPDQKSGNIVSTLSKQSKRVAKPPRYKKQPKKAKIKIAQPTNTQTSDNFNSTPVFIINNFRETTSPKCEVNKSPVVIIQNNYTQNDVKPTITEISPDGEYKIPLSKAIDKNGRVLLPRVEQIFIKTEDTFLSNTNNYINNFTNDTSVIDEPPPISTTEQIKKFTPDLLKVKFNSSIFQKVKDLEMLPSMPFLQTPVKEPRNFNDDEIEIASEQDPLKIIKPEGTKTPEDNKISEDNFKSGDNFKISEDNLKISEDNFKISEDNFKTSQKSIQINDEIENVETEKDKKDDEDELNALMVASSTMQQKNRRLQPNLTKKAKQMREYNATLAMLCPEDASISDEKAKNFAQAYYDKVQERLESESPLEYQRFVEVLSEHDETRSTVSDLYDKVSSLLSPKHPDLCEEFLSFLTPEQAQQIGKLVPHFMLSNMSLFLRKLEIYYSNQPAQLRRIYNGLTELAGTSDITMDKVKSTILPLLKGNALLIDWFLQMFPQEPPTENLLTDWEQINCDEDDTDEDKKVFETLNLPEVEDPYGGPNCICKCHKIDDEMYKSRARHCIPCGTKFLQGRVYVQTGKGLRLANVTFNNSDSSNVDHINRLTVKPIIRQKRKSETSPSKIIMSPTKDDEPRHSNESEDDINTENTQRKIKTLKPFRTSSPSKPRKKPTQKVPKTKKETVKTKPTSQKKIPKVAKKKVDKKETKKTETPEGEKVESETEEMDTCEESSQDTLEESDDSLEEIVTSEDSNSPQDTTENSTTWTRDEDKTILETVQKCPENEDVYKLIRKLLPGRTEAEIKHRLQLLITLIRTKMSP